MSTAPALSIIVPVYNEQRTLERVMASITAAMPQAEIIYVDDGSRDGSLAMLKANARPQDIVLTKPNGGKGSAIRMGLTRAGGTYTVIQDADLEYQPAQITLLLDEARRHPGDVVFGSRFLQKNPNRYKRFLIGNRVMSGCLNILFGSHISDSYTCYKLLPTAAFRSLDLSANGFEIEAEICAKCLKRGMVVREIPIAYMPRTIEEGKKINWKDAVRGLRMMCRIRFGGQR